MLNSLFRKFKKPDKSVDPLNGYTVGKGYELLISKQSDIGEWSICQICLDVIANRRKNVPDSYWCCPECASEAIELPYTPLRQYLAKNSTESLQNQLLEWQKKHNLVASYKLLKEKRLSKLIGLSNVT